MIEEAFVSLEVAKILRDRGFNEPTFRHFYNDKPDNSVIITYQKNNGENYNLDYCSRPSHQTVIEWLIEKHKISLEVRASFNLLYDVMDPNLPENAKIREHTGWEYSIVFLDTGEEIEDCSIYDSRFEATEEGFKDILEKYV